MLEPPARNSKATGEQQDENDDKNYSQPSRREITPVPAMRPSRQRSEECQNQEHDQYGSKHCLLLLPGDENGAAALKNLFDLTSARLASDMDP
jgi:hypothetical protein